MKKLEKQVARILAVEFVRTGVVDCPRMARLVCRAITPKKATTKKGKRK